MTSPKFYVPKPANFGDAIVVVANLEIADCKMDMKGVKERYKTSSVIFMQKQWMMLGCYFCMFFYWQILRFLLHLIMAPNCLAAFWQSAASLQKKKKKTLFSSWNYWRRLLEPGVGLQKSFQPAAYLLSSVQRYLCVSPSFKLAS